MKNNFFYIFFALIFFSNSLFAENLNIQSKNISIDKSSKLTVFNNEVVAKNNKGNEFQTNYAEYDKNFSLLKSKGETTILTSEGFLVSGENIIFDNKKKLIKSNDNAVITDLEGNNIFLEKFEYSTKNNFFKSSGNIEVIDSKKNSYKFSQIYIDEIKREIIGSDIKAYLNDPGLKINKKNKPRVFANTVRIKDQTSKFDKSIFTLCDYRENDKCPPWSLQANQMSHDKNKKTVYYDNAVIKFFDIPIFYIPKLSHPDPSVDRRSGFLTPSFADTRNLGSSISIPYYWTLGKNRDFTLSSRLFTSEHPLFLGEYRQAFNQANLILDLGYTEGYNNTSKTKKPGSKSHIFSSFTKDFEGKNNSRNVLQLKTQNISQDKYLKLYRIKSNLVNYNEDTLENSLDFTHEEENLFFGLKMAAYETIKNISDDKYEYILPEMVLSKNLFSNSTLGSLDFQSNLKVHNYETNKLTKFLVNDLDWKFKEFKFLSGLQTKLLGNIKNVNYESKNVSEYKDEFTNEIFGALGILNEVDLYKKTVKDTSHTLTPKFLLRYAPGHMRKESNGARLSHLNVFSLDRLNSFNNFENGLSAALGFDYKLDQNNKKFDISVAQIVNEKENKLMPKTSSLNQKLSDVVGASNLEINDNFKINYNFSLDQNMKDFNYNEIGSNISLSSIKFNLSYLQEQKHIGNQEYFKTGLVYEKGDSGLFTFNAKRNLITSSAEYYNLSYEYINDCLRAGLVFRREFYNDSEIEPEDSLMFKISFTPLGEINSPSFN